MMVQVHLTSSLYEQVHISPTHAEPYVLFPESVQTMSQVAAPPPAPLPVPQVMTPLGGGTPHGSATPPAPPAPPVVAVVVPVAVVVVVVVVPPPPSPPPVVEVAPVVGAPPAPVVAAAPPVSSPPQALASRVEMARAMKEKERRMSGRIPRFGYPLPMAVQTHKRPELREPILRLLEQLLPVVQGGGEVPLVALVEAVAGDKLSDKVRSLLAGRGGARFTVQGAEARFANEGPDVKIELKKFNIKIPPRLSGTARIADGGAVLRFAGRETLSATKLLFSVKLEALELHPTRIFVDMEGDSFDQVYELV